MRTAAGRRFAPQPFLAMEIRGKRFLHDNLGIDAESGTWFYAFHGDTLALGDVRRIGVGTCEALGRSCVKVIDAAVES